ADAAALRGVDDRLVVEDELAALDGVPKIAGETDRAGAVEVLLLFVHLHPAARALRRVHRDVRAAHQRLHVLAVVGTEDDADARLDERALALDDEGLLEGLEDALRDHRRLVTVRGQRDEDRVFVAAEARDGVRRAYGVDESLADLAEDHVAG